MSIFGPAKRWLRAVFRRDATERDMLSEMSAHIEQAAERYVLRGMSERDALYAARREFGAMAAIQEQARDSRMQRARGQPTCSRTPHLPCSLRAAYD